MRDREAAPDSPIPDVVAKRAGIGPVIGAGLATGIAMARCLARARETLYICQRETGMALTI